MLRSDKNKHNDGHYYGRGKRRTDYKSHAEYVKNNPPKIKNTKSRSHHKKTKPLKLEKLLEWAIVGTAIGAFAYLGSRGYLPEIKTHHVNEISQKYSSQYQPIQTRIKEINARISTRSSETSYLQKEENYSVKYSTK